MTAMERRQLREKAEGANIKLTVTTLNQTTGKKQVTLSYLIMPKFVFEVVFFGVGTNTYS
jgi:hypothetical protein